MSKYYSSAAKIIDGIATVNGTIGIAVCSIFFAPFLALHWCLTRAHDFCIARAVRHESFEQAARRLARSDDPADVTKMMHIMR